MGDFKDMVPTIERGLFSILHIPYHQTEPTTAQSAQQR
jgi:hypothetical protein